MLTRRTCAAALFAAVTVAACGGGGSSNDAETTTSAPPATTATTAAPSTSSAPAPTTTTAPEEPASALTPTDGGYRIDWAGVADPFFAPPDTGAADPLYLIHTNPQVDGFYFALELYTTGYGALWTGELGVTELGCSEPPPSANSTGICVQFDPDGPGPGEPLDGFSATGSLEILRLDDTGYDIDLGSVTFGDGTVVEAFRLTG